MPLPGISEALLSPVERMCEKAFPLVMSTWKMLNTKDSDAGEVLSIVVVPKILVPKLNFYTVQEVISR